MPFTIFYAWQMDTDTGLNRWFIENAIKKAIKRIKADTQQVTDSSDMKLDAALPVEEGEANAVNPEPESDDAEIIYQWGAVGSSGAKLIGEEILARIKTCGVFIGDVTFVSTIETPDGRDKWLPNANVLLETGAASQSGDGWNRIILVLNQALGSVDCLPFDLKFRHCTVQYALATKDDPDKKEKQKRLTDAFVTEIKPIYVKAMKQIAEDKRRITEATLANARSRAEKIREEYEQKVLADKYYTFKSVAAVIAATITPVGPTPIAFTDEFKIRTHFNPAGSASNQIIHKPKSVTVGEHGAPPAHNMTELTNTGIVYITRNLAYGRDSIKPLSAQLIDPTKPWSMSMENCQPQFVGTVWRTLKGLAELGAMGPWFLTLSFLKMRNGRLLFSYDGLSAMESGNHFQEDHMHADMILIPADIDLASPEPTFNALKPPLKEIWRHNGYRGMPIYHQSPIGYDIAMEL